MTTSLFDLMRKYQAMVDVFCGIDPAAPGRDMTSMVTMGTITGRMPAKFVPPVQKPKPKAPAAKPQYLVWSPGFGLRFEEDKGQWAPGTYKRILTGAPVIVKKWYVLVRTKDHRGRNIKLDWREVSREQLPKQIFTEALLLDIQP